MDDILQTLKKFNNDCQEEIESWLSEKRKESAPFFYTSVDLRHSGRRLVPVDTNLFPAGFNNLSPRARARASNTIARFIEEDYPSAKRVLIIPENHTRNLGYLENLHVLKSLLEHGGSEVRIGSFIAEMHAPLTLETGSGATITEYPLIRDGAELNRNDEAPEECALWQIQEARRNHEMCR